MKKLFFSIVMMLALVIVAGTAMAQTSSTPYPGGTYSYTMNGIDPGTVLRTARVFLDNDGIAATPNLAVASKYAVTSGLTVTSATNYFDIALPIGTTSLTFTINYDLNIATGPYQLYVVLYDGNDTKCSNFIYTNITVTANNFDLALAATPFTCQVINTAPDVDVPASNDQNTTFTYTITKQGGDSNDDWSFDFKLTASGTSLSFDDITNAVPTVTTGTGTAVLTGTPNTGDYNIRVANTTDASVVTLTLTIPTTPGVADSPFAATISAPKLYLNQTTNVILSAETVAGSGANNTATVTVTRLPSIGTFSGN